MCWQVNLTDWFIFGDSPATPNVIMSVCYMEWDSLNYMWAD